MLLWRAGLRYLLRHQAVLLLSVIGVALGVAVVIAIDLANASALRAFLLSNEALSGKVTHQIVGNAPGVPEQVYVKLRRSLAERNSAPVVEGTLRVRPAHPAGPAQAFTLLGLDLFAEAPFRDLTRARRVDGDLARLLVVPGAVALSVDVAQRLGVQLGDALQAQVDTTQVELPVVALLYPQSELERQGLGQTIVTDLASAQELLGRQGFLSRIDLRLADASQAQRVSELLPPGLRVVAAQQRSYAMVQMTQAFRINLTALSLLALVVGMFLIYNTMTFSVVQRRALLGTLRVIGVTRRQVYWQILVESLVLGALGTTVGLALGIGLGQGLVRLVARTINDLYFTVQVTGFTLTGASLVKGVALGLGASVVSALAPALEAARTPPRVVMLGSILEARVSRAIPYVSALGVLFLAGGTLVLWLGGINLVVGFVALFALILGFALLTPLLTVILVRLLQPLMGVMLGLMGRMAVRGIRTTLSRTGVAIAALAVAIAATVGVAIMVQSFRLAVDQWLANYLRADVFISRSGADSDFEHRTLDPRLAQAFAHLDGVRFVSSGRRVDLVVPQGIVQLFALNIPRDSFSAFRLKEGDPAAVEAAFYERNAVIVSEPFSQRHGVGVGDRISLPTDAGAREFAVAGVYFDYGSDQGYVTMYRPTYDRYWNDRGVTSMGLYAEPATDAMQLEQAARRVAAPIQDVQVYSNRALRQESLAIFDRTFMVTNVVRMLAILVAFVGVLSALMAIQMERAREMAMLRATGLTPRQLWGLVLSETATIGLIAGIIALPLGVALSLGLILVINELSFGWSMPIHVDASILWQALGLAVVAALVAGIYPAKRMAATSPALALRQD